MLFTYAMLFLLLAVCSAEEVKTDGARGRLLSSKLKNLGNYTDGSIMTKRRELEDSRRNLGCKDTNKGLKDSYGDGCEWYDDYPTGCGNYDVSGGFRAHAMCCSCGGGAQTQDDHCSAADYLTFCGRKKAPSFMNEGVVDTHDCDRGFDFIGNRESVVQYDIDLGETGAVTFMAWIKLDDFDSDVGVFSYGNYNERCGLMLQLRVNRFNKDMHIRAKSTKANTFHEYNSNQGIFTWWHRNTWFHVAIVKSANKINFYLNGEPVGEKYFADKISGCHDTLQLGRWIENAQKAVDGHMKNIRIMKSAIGPRNVKEIYLGRE